MAHRVVMGGRGGGGAGTLLKVSEKGVIRVGRWPFTR